MSLSHNALIKRASFFYKKGDYHNALIFLNEVIKTDSLNFSVLIQIASCYENLGQYQKSLNCLNKVQSYLPNNFFVLNQISIILSKGREYKKALEINEKLISIQKNNPQLYNNKGIFLQKIGKFEKSISAFNRAIRINSEEPKFYNNKGNSLMRLNLINEAVSCYEMSISLNSAYSSAYYNLSLAYLTLGEFKKGWEYYEYRIHHPDVKLNHPKISLPLWSGEENLRGKKIYIYVEQGYGDMIQFSRYLKLITDMGAEIFINFPKVLAKLFANFEKIVLVSDNSFLQKVDYYCPLMSLPNKFKTTLENIPDPLVFQNFPFKKSYSSIFKKVGIVWRGSKTNINDKVRSINLRKFDDILRLNLEFHSFQIDHNKGELSFLNEYKVLSYDEKIEDFLDTAKLVHSMDLIITVDTAIAHLAGTLNKSCWLMLPFHADFRWMLETDLSPWYKSLRIFRQKELDNWDSVISNIYKELTEKIK